MQKCFYICFKTNYLQLFLYNIFCITYTAAIKLAALWNRKAGLWVAGRKNIFTKLEQWKSGLAHGRKLIWMHCASLGEFEQGRPVLEDIRKKYPDYAVVISFFSPSGYEVRKNYAGADAVFYLPADGKKNAEKWIDILQPSLVIWVKYEYWYYYITGLANRKIPLLLISAIFRNQQPFFKWYGALWKKMLGCFTAIFAQNSTSVQMVKKILPGLNALLTGDTRFDRVIAIAEKKAQIPELLINFCKGFSVIVAGSTWQEDEEEIVHFAKMHPQVKIIIAPHEVDAERLAEVQQLFLRSALLSGYQVHQPGVQVLIIDNIGMLASLYKLASIAYVGGGFNSSGIHNILEAAVYGVPVIFGPEYEKFIEAEDLADIGGAFSIDNALELEALLTKLLSNTEQKQRAGDLNKKYVYEKAGATAVIMHFIQEKRLLTN